MRKVLSYIVVLAVGLALGAAPSAFGRKQQPAARPTNAQLMGVLQRVLTQTGRTDLNAMFINDAVGTYGAPAPGTVLFELDALRSTGSSTYSAVQKLCRAQGAIC